MPAAELLDAAEQFPALNQNHELFEGWPMPINWVPCVDGRFLTDQYGVTLAQGSQQPVDIIVGNTTGEFMETAADGTVIAAGEQGNLELMQAWVQGAPIRLFITVLTLPCRATMPAHFTPRIYGSHSTISENAGVLSPAGTMNWQT